MTQKLKLLKMRYNDNQTTSQNPNPPSVGCFNYRTPVRQTYWLYHWHVFNEDLSVGNTRSAAQNVLDSRKINDLNAASVRINGLYLRLQDSLPAGAPQICRRFPLRLAMVYTRPNPPSLRMIWSKEGSPRSHLRYAPEAILVMSLGPLDLNFIVLSR